MDDLPDGWIAEEGGRCRRGHGPSTTGIAAMQARGMGVSPMLCKSHGPDARATQQSRTYNDFLSCPIFAAADHSLAYVRSGVQALVAAHSAWHRGHRVNRLSVRGTAEDRSAADRARPHRHSHRADRPHAPAAAAGLSINGSIPTNPGGLSGSSRITAFPWHRRTRRRPASSGSDGPTRSEKFRGIEHRQARSA